MILRIFGFVVHLRGVADLIRPDVVALARLRFDGLSAGGDKLHLRAVRAILAFTGQAVAGQAADGPSAEAVKDCSRLNSAAAIEAVHKPIPITAIQTIFIGCDSSLFRVEEESIIRYLLA